MKMETLKYWGLRIGVIAFNVPAILKGIKTLAEWIGLTTSPEDAMGLFDKLHEMPWWVAIFMAFSAWLVFYLHQASIARQPSASVPAQNRAYTIEKVEQLRSAVKRMEELCLSGRAMSHETVAPTLSAFHFVVRDFEGDADMIDDLKAIDQFTIQALGIREYQSRMAYTGQDIDTTELMAAMQKTIDATRRVLDRTREGIMRKV